MMLLTTIDVAGEFYLAWNAFLLSLVIFNKCVALE